MFKRMKKITALCIVVLFAATSFGFADDTAELTTSAESTEAVTETSGGTEIPDAVVENSDTAETPEAVTENPEENEVSEAEAQEQSLIRNLPL